MHSDAVGDESPQVGSEGNKQRWGGEPGATADRRQASAGFSGAPPIHAAFGGQGQQVRLAFAVACQQQRDELVQSVARLQPDEFDA